MSGCCERLNSESRALLEALSRSADHETKEHVWKAAVELIGGVVIRDSAAVKKGKYSTVHMVFTVVSLGAFVCLFPCRPQPPRVRALVCCGCRQGPASVCPHDQDVVKAERPPCFCCSDFLRWCEVAREIWLH